MLASLLLSFHRTPSTTNWLMVIGCFSLLPNELCLVYENEDMVLELYLSMS